MRTYYRIFPVLVLLSVLLVGCRSHSHKPLGLYVDVATSDSDSVWYAFEYGANRVYIDTIYSKDGRLSLNRPYGTDTMDLVSIYDSRGVQILSLFPDTVGIELYRKKLRDTLVIKGIKSPTTLYRWLSIRRIPSQISVIDSLTGKPQTLDTLSLEARRFLSDHISTRLGYMLLRQCKEDRSLRYSDRHFVDSLSLISESASPKLVMLLGLQPDRSRLSYNVGARFPYSLPEVIPNKNERIPLDKFRGKHRHIAVQIFDLSFADSLTRAHYKAYLHLIDSLKIPSYTAIPNAMSVPKGWTSTAKLKKTDVYHYVLIDTVGEASLMARELDIQRVPTIFLLDSTAHVIHKTYNVDSMSQYIRGLKYYQPKKKK